MNTQTDKIEPGKKYIKDDHPFVNSYVEVSRVEKDRIYGRMFVQNRSYFEGRKFELIDRDCEKMWLLDLHQWRPFYES